MAEMLKGKIQEIKLVAKCHGTFKNFRCTILFLHGYNDHYSLKWY